MNRIRIRCFLSLFLLLIIGGTMVTYAWFSSRWTSGQSHWEALVGKTPPPEATLWLYSTDLEESNDDARGWVEHTLTGNEQDPHAFLLPSVQSQESDGVYTFEMKSLHLGTVDNLVLMTQDNIVCLRFAFDPEIHGNSTARLSMDLSDTLGQEVRLYDANGGAVTDTALMEQLMALHEQNSFLQYQACVSTQALSPDDDGFQALAFSEETRFGEELDLYDGMNTPITDPYYVYITITPNLSAFAPASELLNAYMPCVMLFDTQIQLTVY